MFGKLVQRLMNPEEHSLDTGYHIKLSRQWPPSCLVHWMVKPTQLLASTVWRVEGCVQRRVFSFSLRDTRGMPKSNKLI